MPSPPRRPEATHRDRTRRGAAIAAAAGAAGAAVVGWYLLFGSSPIAVPPPVRPGELQPPKRRATADPRLEQASDVRLDLMDKDQPTRQAGELRFASMDPLEAHHYAAEEPRAMLFLKDGRTVHIRSDKARLYMPDRSKEPESGTLTGHVVVRVYEARSDGKRIDPEKEPPSATFRTDTLAFDGALGRLDTPDRVTVSSGELSFTGRGMRMIFNQVRERLELLEFAQGEELRYTPAPDGAARQAKKPTAPAPASSGPRTGQAAAVTPAAPAKQPIETLYRVVFNETVTAAQEQRTIAADTLTVWARFIDNALPAGAVAEVRAAPAVPGAAPAVQEHLNPPRAETGVAAAWPGLPSPPAPPASLAAFEPMFGPPGPRAGPDLAAREGAGPPAPTPPSPLVLRWTGPCVVTALDTAPSELKHEHVALRFAAEKSGLVTMADTARGATGHGAYLEYGATTRHLTLAGPGPSSGALSIPGTGTIENGRIETRITDEATVVHCTGPTVLTAAVAEGSREEPATVSCSEQADFLIANRDGAVTNALRMATFQGSAKATQGSAVLKGDSVRAEFGPGQGEPAVLTKLVVEGHSAAESPDMGKLKAERIEAGFKAGTRGSRPEPTSLLALRNVELSQGGTELHSQSLEAALAAGAGGAVEVRSATARGEVRYADRAEGLSAECEELKAEIGPPPTDGGARRQVVDLTGERTVIRRGEQSTIRGTQMRLDGESRGVQVFGKGEFDHKDPSRAAGGPASLHATWVEGMTFDDTAGLLRCDGAVVADAETDPLQRDHIEAAHIVLHIAPRRPAEAGPTLEGPGSRKDKERKLLRAEATGSVLEREGGENARIESRRYVEDKEAAEGRRMTELYYVEGGRVQADNEKGTMDVPGAGKMLLVDHRAPRAAPAPGAADGASADQRGTALFDWKGSMHLDRASGEAVMKQGVRLTHQRLETRDITNLAADELTARFRETPVAGDGGAVSAAPKGELLSAVAVGSVHLDNGPERTPGQPKPPTRELAADRLEYDAVKRTADASAKPGGVVTMFEPSKQAPVSARRLLWDLASDRVRILEPGPVAVPR